MRNCKENHLALPLRYHINNDYSRAKILIIYNGVYSLLIALINLESPFYRFDS